MTSLLERNIGRQRDDIQMAVQMLTMAPRQQFELLFSSWQRGMRTLWQGDTQTIMDALGADVVELFAISNKTIAFLEELRPGCTVETLALMKPYTIVDGRLVITEPSPEAP